LTGDFLSRTMFRCHRQEWGAGGGCVFSGCFGEMAGGSMEGWLPYGTRFRFWRIYPGLTSWANVCRPYGAGVWQLRSSVFAQEAGNGELRTAVPGAYPGLASLRQVQGRLWADVCRPQRVCVGTSGVPPGRGSIYCFPGAERAGLLSAAPPGQESLGLVRLHRPKSSSHADSPRLISLAKEAS